MKLYWRFKKDGKWTWKAASREGISALWKDPKGIDWTTLGLAEEQE